MFLTLVILSVFGCAFAAPPIVGGYNANIEDYPFQVSMMNGGFHSCGGSILNADTILTAAHCLERATVKWLTVRAGSSSKTVGGQIVQVKSFTMHPLFDASTFDNDVAILKLSSDLVFGPGVQPIELPSNGLEINAGTITTVTGWGALYSGGSSPNRLQVVQVPVVDQTVCTQALLGRFPITPRHLCASEQGRDACNGDSGGPLTLNGQVVGIVSWGWGCADAKYPGVYARVSEFISWIEPQL